MSKKTIGVSLVAFMDMQLPLTVEDIFNKAKCPENIKVYVSNQDIEPYEYNGKYQVEVTNIHPKKSEGYCWCRHNLNKTIDTDYYCQIAPHSRLREGWDEFMINEHEKLSNGDKVVLCGRPIDFYEDGSVDDNLTYSKPIRFDTNLVVSLERTEAKPHQEVCYMQAGAIFTTTEWIKEVPYDPHIYIWGEEPDISMRSWLNDWKMIIPSQMQFYHLYGQKMRKGHSRDYVNYDHLNGLGKLRARIKLGLVPRGNFPEAEKEFDKWFVDGSKYKKALEEEMKRNA